MSTTRSKDRAGLCSFTFANGHRCRSLRSTSHPHLCYYHARKESQARAAEEIGRDISYFFSGRYLSACDLTAVLARLFSAVASGELKPKTATTLAYLAQTLLQAIHLAQHEYIIPPGPIILKFIPANFHSRCMTTQLAEPASCSPDYSSRCANLDSCAIIRKSQG